MEIGNGRRTYSVDRDKNYLTQAGHVADEHGKSHHQRKTGVDAERKVYSVLYLFLSMITADLASLYPWSPLRCPCLLLGRLSSLVREPASIFLSHHVSFLPLPTWACVSYLWVRGKQQLSTSFLSVVVGEFLYRVIVSLLPLPSSLPQRQTATVGSLVSTPWLLRRRAMDPRITPPLDRNETPSWP